MMGRNSGRDKKTSATLHDNHLIFNWEK